MRQRFLNSLAFRLGLITLVSLVPAILVALSFSHDVREHIETEARLLASQKAERIAGVGREIVSGGRHELMALTRLHEIHTLNSPKARAVLHDAFLQSPNTLTYALYDLFGNAITASRHDVMPPSVKKEAWFQHVVASLTCSQGERAMTQLPANHLLVQACPVLKDSGDITGVLVLGIDFSWFQHAMRQLDLPPGSSAMVVDAHGVIVAQTLRDSANDAKVIPDAPRLMPLVAKGLTTQLAPGLDGVDRLYAFSRLTNQPGHELYVRVGIPVHKAYAQADYATRKSLAGLLLVALVSLIAAFLLSDTILKPSEDILEATKRLAEGDLSHRIHSQAKGELADLAHGVDTMADALETSTKALRQTEEKVRQILEHSVEGYFESTWEGRFVTANPAMLRMMGYDSLEQLDQHILSIAQQFYVQPHRRTELLDTLLRDGQVQGFEFESYRKDGSIYWTVLSARTLVDEDGNTIAIQGFASDISIRKQIEMELMRSNERFMHVLENQTDAIFVADYETNVVLFANTVVRSEMGESVLGKPCWAAIRGGMGTCESCPRKQLLDAHGEPLGVATREEYHPRTNTWSLVRVQAMRWTDGRLVRLETLTDITDIKRAQEELHTTSDHLRGILAHSPTLISIRDNQGRFLLMSETGLRVLGKTESEILGHTPSEILPPHLVEQLARKDAVVLKEGRPISLTLDLPTPAGESRTFLLSMFPITDATGQPEKVCTIGTDITERVVLERELTAAKEAAEAASNAKSDFLAKMSHEIRTPLNAILGFTDLADMADNEAERHRSTAALRESGRMLLSLVNDLLDLSRVESGHLKLERIPFSLRAEVHAALEHAETEARRKHLSLTVSIDPAVPDALVGDPVRLQQILLNLTNNALKFTHQGDITVRFSTPAARGNTAKPGTAVTLEISVADTGIGIAPEAQEHIFAKFTQADSSTSRKYGGSGLGLAICRQLSQRMGGDIQLISTPGQGSTFTAVLRLEQATSLEVHAADSAGRTIATVPSTPPLAILLAEDTPANVIITQAYLKRLGHACDHAENGGQALEMLAIKPYDLVLMDVEMPGMDGLEATRRLRDGQAGELNRTIPVLAMTAHVLSSFRTRSEEAGMTGFLPKPVSYTELATALVGMPHRAHQTSATVQPNMPIQPNMTVQQAHSKQGETTELTMPQPILRPFAPQRSTRKRPAPHLLDLDSALARLGGHAELLQEVLEVYAEDIPEKRSALREALDRAEAGLPTAIATMRLVAHSLKSASASIGADPASRAAADLEHAAQRGETSHLRQLVLHLDHQLAATLAELERQRTVRPKPVA